MKVFKFGGASVKDADSVRNMASIIQQNQDTPLVVIVSAMGKMTNALERLLAVTMAEEDTDDAFNEIKEGTVTFQKFHFRLLHILQKVIFTI